MSQLCKDLLYKFHSSLKYKRNNSWVCVHAVPSQGFAPAECPSFHICVMCFFSSFQTQLSLHSLWDPLPESPLAHTQRLLCWAPIAPTKYHEPQHLVGLVESVSLVFPNQKCEHLKVSTVCDTSWVINKLLKAYWYFRESIMHHFPP